MRIMDVIKGKVGGRTTLEKVSVDDLRLDKIKLEQMEKRLVRRVDKAENGKESAFQLALKTDSNQRQKIYARKIKELDAEVQGVQRQLQQLSRQIRVVNGLLMVKEIAISDTSQNLTVINRLSLSELTNYITQATASGELNQELLQELVATVEEGVSVLGDGSFEDDGDVEDILAVIQRTREGAELGGTVTLSEGLSEVDGILHRQEEDQL